MSPNEFLITLEEELKYLPAKKRKVILKIYQEKINNEIDQGTPEEKITQIFNQPEVIAKEIYEKEGINYLDRRKRKLKSDNVFKMIVSSILLILTISAFVVLSVYTFIIIRRFINLIIVLPSVKEKISIGIFIFFLLISILLIYLYLLDLIILIFNYLLDKILIPFNKSLHFADFSIIDKIEEGLKKPKLYKKTLITFSVLTLFFSIVNFTLKTYVYRAFMKVEPSTYIQEIDLNNYQTSNIKFDLDEAKVNIHSSDEYMLTVKSEFVRDVKFEVKNNQLIITADKIKTYDLFDFLKEPLPVYDLYLPDEKEMVFDLANGTISLENITLTKAHISLNNGNIIIKNANINDTILKTTSVGISMIESTTKDIDLSIKGGVVNLEKTTTSNVSINNASANVNIKETTMNNLKIKSNNAIYKIESLNCASIDALMYAGTFDIDKCNASSSIVVKSQTGSNISLSRTNAQSTEVVNLGGSVVYYDVKSPSKISTAGTLVVSGGVGDYDITCLGNFLTIQKCHFNKVTIECQKCESSLKFITADELIYNGKNATTTAYFIFGKKMKLTDTGDLHLDNDRIILSENEQPLYDEYYQKIEQMMISSNATYRIEDKNVVGDWE